METPVSIQSVPQLEEILLQLRRNILQLNTRLQIAEYKLERLFPRADASVEELFKGNGKDATDHQG